MIILELHNEFNMLRERSVQNLERLIKTTIDPYKKDLFEIMLFFTKKYDWFVSWNLVRVLERR